MVGSGFAFGNRHFLLGLGLGGAHFIFSADRVLDGLGLGAHCIEQRTRRAQRADDAELLDRHAQRCEPRVQLLGQPRDKLFLLAAVHVVKVVFRAHGDDHVARGVAQVAVRERLDAIGAEVGVEGRHLLAIELVRDGHVHVDGHGVLRVERQFFVERAAFVHVLRPDHALHVSRVLNDRGLHGVVEHEPGDDVFMRDAAIDEPVDLDARVAWRNDLPVQQESPPDHQRRDGAEDEREQFDRQLACRDFRHEGSPFLLDCF